MRHRVFTEQGVSMPSAVLRSPTAVAVSVRIMDAFVEMRHFIADNAPIFEQIRSINHRLDSFSLHPARTIRAGELSTIEHAARWRTQSRMSV